VPRVSPGAGTYCYCLVQRRTPPSLGRAPAGPPGLAPPRSLPVGESLWLVAANAPLARFGADAINARLRDLTWVSTCAMAHEAVIEHVARSGAVVPMKLFTLFTSDARALAHVARSRARLGRILKRVAGRQEWGVRLTLDESRAAAAARRGRRAGLGGTGAGTRFLLRKRAEHGLAGRLAARARVEAERLYRALRLQADAARRRPPLAAPAGTRLLLDAAFLVPAGGAARFRSTARAIARRLATGGYRLTLTGPWPPYNFVGDRG